LSTYTPNKKNLKDLSKGNLLLKIAPGERLVIVGTYEIAVRSGQISLLGSTLKAGKSRFRVDALPSHALPVIRCLQSDLDAAEICIYQCHTGLELLANLSPRFGGLWDSSSGPLGTAYSSLIRNKHINSSFQIVYPTMKASIRPLTSPPEWNEALAKVSRSNQGKPPIVMICGPKSSGKSTFTKLLTNKFWSTPAGVSKSSSENRNAPSVALLDLDPGQPEYSPPGQLSLIHIQEPNYGPPYSHPIPPDRDQLIRSHTIAALTPSLDPSLYMDCALDLFMHYRSLLSRIPGCPLVVNTPGWILGTGLEILVDLISKIQPSSVIYMSQEGPEEVVESLRDAAMQIPLIMLPSQTGGYMGRTAAHLRLMQYMSYFHLYITSSKELNWNGQTLDSMRPWEIRYSGNSPGILGIMCYGDQPSPDMLGESINGCIVAVVILDNMTAIRGLDTKDRSADISSEETRSFIIQTPSENLPYFDPTRTFSLDPKCSRTEGLALIRGIDIKRRRLQILTPIAASIIEEAQEAGKPMVLVSGKLDTPGWAYTEIFIQQSNVAQVQGEAISEANAKEGEDILDDELELNQQDPLELDTPLPEAPWIEKLEGSQGRGVGARVWRVRRDLGKTGA
ncbi:hypothetical protein F5884DRAFT_657436, partial [Xylogone sp. PMI_703]